MDRKAARAFLMSRGEDSAWMNDEEDNAGTRAALLNSQMRGVGAFDPVSSALSLVGGLLGSKKPLHPDVIPNQPKTWHKSTATGYPYQSYTDANGSTHIMANNRDYNLDNSGDSAAWAALKITQPPAAVLASAPATVGGTAGTGLTTGSFGSITTNAAGLSLSSPLVLGGLALLAVFLLKRRR